MLGAAFFGGVGQQAAGGTADAGQNADDNADDRGDDEVGNLGDELLHRQAVALQVIGFLLKAVGQVPAVDARLDDVCNGEHTDEQHSNVKAGQQLVVAEGEAAHGVHRSHAHHGKGQTEQAGQQSLEHILARQSGDNGQGKNRDGKVFRRPKEQAHLGQQRGNKDQGDDSNDGADARGQDAHPQGPARLAPLRHGSAVKDGGDGGGRTGDFQQDGGNQSAGDAAHIQAHQQSQAHSGLHAEGEGQEEHHRHGGGQAGDRAKDDAQHGSAPDQEQAHGVKDIANRGCKHFHFFSPSLRSQGYPQARAS